jgi:lipoprotein-anchoring transpeptidase ErfK/SrfK
VSSVLENKIMFLNRNLVKILFIVSCFVFGPNVFANGLLDTDHDAVPDQDEIQVYYTDPYNADTDGDSYNDFEEINAGFSPHNPAAIKLIDSDLDMDGLSDAWEIKFKSNPVQADSDGDGFKDGEEVEAGFNPVEAQGAKLEVSLNINLATQTLNYLLNGFVWQSFPISTGKASMPTPKGTFAVLNKIERAWSKTYGLWMPYWLGLSSPGIGIHELPVWPSGYREGENHLGTPVSHGCIRLGLDSALYVYEHVESETKVLIY